MPLKRKASLTVLLSAFFRRLKKEGFYHSGNSRAKVTRTGYQQGSMAGSITEKSIINDYAEGPAVTNNPSRRVKPI